MSSPCVQIEAELRPNAALGASPSPESTPPLNPASPPMGDAHPERSSPVHKSELIGEEQLIIRSMDARELEMVVGWAAKEGWNPGKSDPASYYAFDPNGFLLLLLNGVPIGCIAAVGFAAFKAFIGLFIVLAEHRNKGYGTRLLAEATNFLKTKDPGTDISLYSVKAQELRYRKAGFEKQYDVLRFKLPKIDKAATVNFDAQMGEGTDRSFIVIKGSPVLDAPGSQEARAFQRMVKYDSKIFGDSRRRFIKNMLDLPGSIACVCSEKTVRDGVQQILGYGVIQPCENGYRLGPLYCKDLGVATQLAQILLKALVNRLGDDAATAQVTVDIPGHQDTMPFASALRLERDESNDTVAMQQGDHTDGDDRQWVRLCFSLGSLTFGK